MEYEILKLLSSNARYTADDIATMLGADVKEVENTIKKLEKDGMIRGYKAVIDWDKLDGAYKEVEAVYLMSGNYDLNVIVKGKTLQDVARFVARELATIDSVNSTATHFVMRRYKEMDVKLISPIEDDRGQLWV